MLAAPPPGEGVDQLLVVGDFAFLHSESLVARLAAMDVQVWGGTGVGGSSFLDAHLFLPKGNLKSISACASRLARVQVDEPGHLQVIEECRASPDLISIAFRFSVITWLSEAGWMRVGRNLVLGLQRWMQAENSAERAPLYRIGPSIILHNKWDF